METVIKIKGAGGKFLAPVTDEYGNGVCVIDTEHLMIHKGYHYLACHYFSDVDDEGYARMRFVTGVDAEIHALFFMSSTAGVLFTVYKDTTFTNVGGNAVTAISNNPHHAKGQSLIEICHTPGGSGAGTAIVPTLPFGAGGNPAQAGPGQGRSSNEQILEEEKAYLIEAQSLADNNKITVGIVYYWVVE